MSRCSTTISPLRPRLRWPRCSPWWRSSPSPSRRCWNGAPARIWRTAGRIRRGPLRIEVKDLTKRFEDTLVLDRINLAIEPKEFIGLLGPSGSGKTTLLRILGGLEFADSGAVEFDGREASSLSFEERRVGF